MSAVRASMSIHLEDGPTVRSFGSTGAHLLSIGDGAVIGSDVIISAPTRADLVRFLENCIVVVNEANS